MLQRVLATCYYILFFLTPLFFTPLNHELFEYNKMMLVYALCVVAVGIWLIKMIDEKTVLIKRTFLDIPLLLFLLSQILSTVSSIDFHTSVWGYYSRSNGGLLSIISYLLLYYGMVSNFDSKYILRFIKVGIFGGLIVSLYAIPEHFGVSPSCIILTHRVSADCWVQDVQSRVFATLGQPNWLAAYLSMLIFLSIYFLLTVKTKLEKVFYYLTTLAFYMAFTFTFSRGATLGLVAGIVTFLAGVIFKILGHKKNEGENRSYTKLAAIVLVSFILINLFFGSALFRFKLITQVNPPKPSSLAQVTQLEAGGTESGQIRLIVWKGAIEIFKHYPILGSGVETFAYSYYKFRPVEHNLVSEWDFLYNKAHNEYLNYLSTTGIFGFLTYLAVIFSFVYWSVKFVIKKSNSLNSVLLVLLILSSYISYLIQNIFGFSVVIIALFFYLFPGFIFLATDSVHPLKIPKVVKRYNFLFHFLYRRRMLKIIISLVMIYLVVFKIVQFWYADTLFAQGENYSDAGSSGRAYNFLLDAVKLNPNEPFYRSELGFAAAAAAVGLADSDATLSGQLKIESVKENDLSLRMSPQNVSYWRTAIRTNYQLTAIDPSFNQKTLVALDKAISLAPTDPKLYYNKALILSQQNQANQGLEVMKKAVELKSNYRDAHYSLGLFYADLGQKDKAIEEMNIVLKLIPNDPDALKKLDELKK